MRTVPRLPGISLAKSYRRMLKKPASVVLASFRSSTYPRGYVSDLYSLRPCWTVILSILRAALALLPVARSLEIIVEYKLSF
jgi:hypothetical protein